METITILQLTAFAACFILLFVFIAKYHAALEEEQDLEDVADLAQETVSAQVPSFAPRASLLQSVQGPAALEVADLKEQVKELHYRLEELKTATQKREVDVATQLARLEARIGTFEQEFGHKLQPMLERVIEDLEHIKGATPQAEQPQEPLPEPQPDDPQTMSASKSPVPELPEEELKF